MNNSISEKEINHSDLEQSDDNATNQMTAEFTTNVTFPSVTKKVELVLIKMLGHGVIASSDLFSLDSYQDLIDIDDDFIMTGIISLAS